MTMRVAIVLLCGALAAAQQEPREIVVAGRVVSAVDGTPVATALVAAGGMATVKTWTDSDGRFRLRRPGTAIFPVFVQKAGFHEGRHRIESAAGDQDGLTIRLVPESVIAGTAFDSNGEPMEDASVGYYRRANGRLGRWSTRQVDDRGQFRLSGLDRGEYLVFLRPNTWPTANGAVLAAAPLLYPAPSSAARATTLRLRPGDRIENVHLSAPQLSDTTLSIYVSSNDMPCAHCVVSVNRRFGDDYVEVHQGISRPDGSLRIKGLPPGPYSVGFRSRDSEERGLHDVTLAEGRTSQLEATLGRGARMRVVVRELEAQTNEAGSRRRGRRGRPSVQLEFVGPYEARGAQEVSQATQTSPGVWEHTIDGLTPGPHALEVFGVPQGGYVRAALLDGRPVLRGQFAIPRHGVEMETEVVLAFDSGTVEGRIEAEARFPGEEYRLFAIPQAPVLPSDRREIPVDVGDTFAVQVAPGRHDLYALPEGAQWDLADPVDRQRLSAYRTSVEVRAGRKTAVQVKLAPFGPW